METEFFKMDIFFVVTTTVVLVHGVMFAFLLYYLTKVVRDVSEITARVKTEAHEMVEDVRDMREDLKDGISNAKRYTKVVAGASIVRGVSSMMEAFVAAQAEPTSARKRPTPKKSTDE